MADVGKKINKDVSVVLSGHKTKPYDLVALPILRNSVVCASKLSILLGLYVVAENPRATFINLHPPGKLTTCDGAE